MRTGTRLWLELYDSRRTARDPAPTLITLATSPISTHSMRRTSHYGPESKVSHTHTHTHTHQEVRALKWWWEPSRLTLRLLIIRLQWWEGCCFVAGSVGLNHRNSHWCRHIKMGKVDHLAMNQNGNHLHHGVFFFTISSAFFDWRTSAAARRNTITNLL